MTTAIEQRLPAATWTVDKMHSTVDFALKYMVSTFRTGFERFDVTLDTTEDQPRLSGSVDPTSIAVRDENFHAHLQSPEFFDSERHPAITFESTSWRLVGDELRSEEHTSELQSRQYLVCRLLLEKKNTT